MANKKKIRIIVRTVEWEVKDFIREWEINDVRETVLYNWENLDVVDVLFADDPFDLSKYIIHKKKKIRWQN